MHLPFSNPQASLNPIFAISVTGARHVGVILESILSPNRSPKPVDYTPLTSFRPIHLSYNPRLCLNLASFLTLITALAPSLYSTYAQQSEYFSLPPLLSHRSKFPSSIIGITAIVAQPVFLSLPLTLPVYSQHSHRSDSLKA